jgi:hypothetical protein
MSWKGVWLGLGWCLKSTIERMFVFYQIRIQKQCKNALNRADFEP